MKLRFSIVCLSAAACAILAAGCDAPPEPATKDSGGATTGTSNGATSAKGSAAKAPKPIRTAKPKPPRPDEPAEAKGPFPASTDPAMLDPTKAVEPAPEDYHVKFETTAGDFEMDCHRSWAPKAADRFYNLVKIGFYDDVAIFRVVEGFVAQFGIHGDPAVSKPWKGTATEPDPVKESNKRGTLTFAMGGMPKTFTTQVFINFKDNANLDKMGFAPVCMVTGEGMGVVDKFYKAYEGEVSNQQGKIESEGNKFLRDQYKALDYIKTARLVAASGDAPPPAGSAAPSASAPAGSAAPSAAPGSAAPSAKPPAGSAAPKASGTATPPK